MHIGLHAKRIGEVCGTKRDESTLHELHKKGLDALALSVSDQSSIEDVLTDALIQQFHKTSHLVLCVGPSRGEPFSDPILNLLSSATVHLPKLRWVGYLSTIGVYGNHDGNWIDETTPCISTQTRSLMRRQSELGWQALAARWQVPLSILRLSGIYGAGRSAVDDAMTGRARMLIKPGQVFNRIHVEDLAAATVLCASREYNGVVNITDDLPAAPQDVIRYAHELVGKPAPVAVDFATADISPMARSFYSENKRVNNAMSKQVLGLKYQYPTYKAGLDALWQQFDR